MASDAGRGKCPVCGRSVLLNKAGEVRRHRHLHGLACGGSYSNPDQQGHGPCASCGHDPSCGFASITVGDGPEQWLCHTDDHSCYAGPGHPPRSEVLRAEWAGGTP